MQHDIIGDQGADAQPPRNGARPLGGMPGANEQQRLGAAFQWLPCSMPAPPSSEQALRPRPRPPPCCQTKGVLRVCAKPHTQQAQNRFVIPKPAPSQPS
jgi:hypothetical protein